jgi:hypothetical protein
LEILRRANPAKGDPRCDAFMAIFDANVPLPNASNLIFYPLDYDAATNSWGGGRQMGDYDPTPDQIVDWATTAHREKWIRKTIDGAHGRMPGEAKDYETEPTGGAS